MMRLLSLSYDHIPMFEDGIFKLDLFASDKVPSNDESVKELRKPLYSNNVIALAGINASGKTTALNLLRLAGRILNGGLINDTSIPEYFPMIFDPPVTFHCVILVDNSLFLLESILSHKWYADKNATNFELFILDEKIWRVPFNKVRKSFVNDWDKLISLSKRIYTREVIEPDQLFVFVPDDVSAFNTVISFETSNKESLSIVDGNTFDLNDDYGDINDIVGVFDSRIDTLEIKDRGRVFDLSFKRQEPLFLSRDGLEEILSSGTLRGLGLIQRAKQAILTGGLLLVDEIENHLNRKLVSVILELFTSKETNPHGATIVFTTHYPQLLDLIHRKDNVYFLARTGDDTTEIVKYSDRIKRIENKKSEVFASNFIKGTAPKYTDVEKLRKAIKKAVNHVGS